MFRPASCVMAMTSRTASRHSTGQAKVTEMLVLGGGAPTPVGKYDAAIQLLETGVFQANGVTRIGIAGHPEGNPDITKVHGEAMLLKALHRSRPI